MSLSHSFAILDALKTVLDEETALAVIEYRKSLGRKHALNERSAKMMAKQLSKFDDPNAAAEEMILRCWQTIKPEWVRERNTRKVNYVDTVRSIFDGPEGVRGGRHHDELIPSRFGRH